MSTEKKLEGKVFVLTGELENYTRAQIVAKIEELGGKESKTVNKSTNYVLVGSKPGSKLAKAQAINIPVLNEEEFNNLIS